MLSSGKYERPPKSETLSGSVFFMYLLAWWFPSAVSWVWFRCLANDIKKWRKHPSTIVTCLSSGGVCCHPSSILTCGSEQAQQNKRRFLGGRWERIESIPWAWPSRLVAVRKRKNCITIRNWGYGSFWINQLNWIELSSIEAYRRILSKGIICDSSESSNEIICRCLWFKMVKVKLVKKVEGECHRWTAHCSRKHSSSH